MKEASDAILADANGLRSTASPEQAGVIRTLAQAAGGSSNLAELTIDYPADGSIFPPEIVAPTFLWHEPSDKADTWMIELTPLSGVSPRSYRQAHAVVSEE